AGRVRLVLYLQAGHMAGVERVHTLRLSRVHAQVSGVRGQDQYRVLRCGEHRGGHRTGDGHGRGQQIALETKALRLGVRDLDRAAGSEVRVDAEEGDRSFIHDLTRAVLDRDDRGVAVAF